MRGHGGRTAGMVALLVPVAATLMGAGTVSAATTLHVCKSGCPYREIAPAVSAARNGDTITIGPGLYRGGITVDVSVRLAGAGAGRTVIRGGGHVLTIGAFGAAHEPTVAISGVTITGGVARSSPVSQPFAGKSGVWAAGGGVEIPPRAIPSGKGATGGATVRISDSVITGNRADPARAVPSGIPCPGPFPHAQCPFALAAGGGIDSWGHLTLVRTAVTGNSTGPSAGLPAIASDSDGGGISSAQGSLALAKTLVAGNRAAAAAPNGRFAEGGGIFEGLFFTPVRNTVTVRDSLVVRNSTSLSSDLPKFAAGKLIDLGTNSGGIHISDNSPVTVENTAIIGNTVTATDLRGEPVAIDAGMIVGASPLTMHHALFSDNKLFARLATTADTGPLGSVLELDGGATITHTAFTHNSVTVVSPRGVAGNAGAGLAVLNFSKHARPVTVRGSEISHNTAVARTTSGTATVQAAGILNDSLLHLRGAWVTGNTGKAFGPSGIAQGGGIWNGTDISGPPVRLVLDHVAVTRNVLTGSPGITLQGGGLFTERPVTLRHTRIALNRPDQCFGCRKPASSPRNRTAARPHTPSRWAHPGPDLLSRSHT
jgi:hypothetical protein